MDEKKPEETLEQEIADIEQPEEKPVEAPVEQPKPVHHKPELPKKLVKEPSKIGRAIPAAYNRLKSFWIECKRVLRVTKKPDKQEFTTIVKISAAGMAIIGLLGFLIHFAKEFLF